MLQPCRQSIVPLLDGHLLVHGMICQGCQNSKREKKSVLLVQSLYSQITESGGGCFLDDLPLVQVSKKVAAREHISHALLRDSSTTPPAHLK
jgi:hypothetical protein